ncbi:MAG: hypothetical protein AAFP03_01020 [Cyanobacteria bacterium J06598_3]
MSIRAKSGQASTFNVERSHTRSPQPSRFPNKFSATITPFMMFGAIAILTGCHRSGNSHTTNEADNTTVITDASKRPTLPSMATYTLEQTKGKQALGQSNMSLLSPGQHCFHQESNESWLSIRLELSNRQQIKGESAGTITHLDQEKTHYKQSFSGTLARNQALVNVTTNIDGITYSQQEAWTINGTTLDMGRVSITKTPCLEIASKFQS